ncbi:MAG: hypothetical protein IJD92_02325 [Bacilli bacterium]|nr:hypothetical protein [Bacilli bacterium]
MLKKLIKYDIKSILKFLSIFYILVLTFSILSRIFLNIENSLLFNIIGQIFNGASIAMMINIIINNLMRLWVLFKQNFYGDESYLTHTLPIEKKTLYLSKIITSVLTNFLSIIVIAISLLILYYSSDLLNIIKTTILPLLEVNNLSLTGIIIFLIVLIFLELANILQVGYTGIILGHRKNQNKVLYSIIFSFVIYTIMQLILLLIMFIFALINKDFMNIFITNEIVNIDIFKTLVILSISFYSIVLICIGCINIKLFNKGVNVE